MKRISIIYFLLLLSLTNAVRVLIVHTEEKAWVEQVKQNLLHFQQIGLVDVFDARVGSPTLSQLQQYDTVLTWSNYPYFDSKQTGDAIADFIESGGGVCSAVFATTSFASLGGRFVNYRLIANGLQNFGDNQSLGTVYNRNHPILYGVSSFSGGSYSYRTTSTTLFSGAQRIADWTDETILIAAKDGIGSNLAKVVEFGFWPVPSTVYPNGWDFKTDGFKMIVNALSWAALPCAPDLSVSCPDSSIAIQPSTCTANAPQMPVVVSGNCYSVDLNQNLTIGTELQAGSYGVRITATDGRIRQSCASTLKVVDESKPLLSCASSMEVYTDEQTCSSTVPDIRPKVQVQDCSSITKEQNPSAGTIVELGQHWINVTVTDSAGNADICSTLLDVLDHTPPVIHSCSPIEVVSADATCQGHVPWLAGSTSASDNCDGAILTRMQSPLDGSLVTLGFSTVNVTIQDRFGNQAVCTTNLTVVDTTPPTIWNCPQSIVIHTNPDSCLATLPDLRSTLNYTDNCAIAAATQIPSPNTTLQVGNHTITFLVTDSAGNYRNCNSTVSVTDTSPPNLTCQPNVSLNAEETCMASIPDMSNFVNSSDSCSSVYISQYPLIGSMIALGDHNITVYAIDDYGNINSCSVIVKVQDLHPPNIISCSPTQSMSADDHCNALLPFFTNSTIFDDNCSNQSIVTQQPSNGTVFQLGNHTVMITVTDSFGNADDCESIFQVIDTTPPVLQCAGPISENADANCNGNVPNFVSTSTATDNCDPSPTLTQFPQLNSVVKAGNYSITVTATDHSGNAQECITTFVLLDTNAPIITTCAPAQVGEVDMTCKAPVPTFTTSVVATDPCQDDPDISQSPISSSLVGIGNHTILITVSDIFGNQANCDTTFRAIDKLPPNIVCPESILTVTTTACKVPVPNFITKAIVTDNCDTNPLIQQYPDPSTEVDSGIYEINITATDTYGNVAVCRINFTVIDLQEPDIQCPDLHSISVNQECKAEIPEIVSSFNSTNGCNEATIVQNPSSGSEVSIGLYNITITASDSNSDSLSCVTSLLVIDTLPPNVTCVAANQKLEVDDTCHVKIPDYASITNATDNCFTPSMKQVPPANSEVSIGDTEVTVIVDDTNRNEANCTIIVTAIDMIPPIVQCPDPITVDIGNTADCKIPLPDITSLAHATDNCHVQAVTQYPPMNTMIDIGTHNITITAVDESGNKASCSTTYIVKDTNPPVIYDCPTTQLVTANSYCNAPLPNFAGETRASESCGQISLSQSPTAGSLQPPGNISVTITATDNFGNHASCTAVAHIVDITPPVINCPPTFVFELHDSCTYELGNFINQTEATDNCNVSSITQYPNPGSNLPSGYHYITITAFDSSGNDASCIMELIVKDMIPPTITDCPSSVVELADNDCKGIIPDLSSQVEASDECGNVTIVQYPLPGIEIDTGRHTIQFIVSDTFGNTVTCSTNFTLIDQSFPGVSCPGPFITIVPESCNFLVPSVASIATASDNCGIESVTQTPSFNQSVSYGYHGIVIKATDTSGNFEICTTNFTLIDPWPPIFTKCTTDVNLSVDDSCHVPIPNLVFNSTIAFDTCSQVHLYQLPSPGNLISVGNTTVTITASDDAGNINHCITMVTSSDITPPKITCAPSILQDASGVCTVLLPEFMSESNATDNCNIASKSQYPEPGSLLNDGTHNITITATDSYGNVGSCTTQFVLRDIFPPVILKCPPPVTASVDKHCQAGIFDAAAETITVDNCGIGGVIQYPQANTQKSLGTYGINITVFDRSNNTAECYTEMILVDRLPPDITCPPGEFKIATAEETSFVIPRLVPNVIENCPDINNITIQQIPEPGTITMQLSNPILIIVTDRFGNANNCTTFFSVIIPTPENPSNDYNGPVLTAILVPVVTAISCTLVGVMVFFILKSKNRKGDNGNTSDGESLLPSPDD